MRANLSLIFFVWVRYMVVIVCNLTDVHHRFAKKYSSIESEWQ